MPFNENLILEIGKRFSSNRIGEEGLDRSFVEICRFLHENPDRLSWRGKNKPKIIVQADVERLATKFFIAYRRTDFPAKPTTIPDHMVSEVIRFAYDYTQGECDHIKLVHQQAMCAENCVGALLERYLDSVLRTYNWHWCCGDFVKAIDFLRRNTDGTWVALQIKNRDNSENSSSSAIRNGTAIKKWFRSFSRTGATNWSNLPIEMSQYGLSEEGFMKFVALYLQNEKSHL